MHITKKFFLFLIFLIFGCASQQKLITYETYDWILKEKSESEKPIWATIGSKESDINFIYFVGIVTDNLEKLEESQKKSIADGVKKIIEYFGQEGVVLFKERKTELETEIVDEIFLKSEATVKKVKLEKMYYEKYQRCLVPGIIDTKYNVYVLLSYPLSELKEEFDRIEKEKKEKLRLAISLYNRGEDLVLEGDILLAISQYEDVMKLLKEISGVIEIDGIKSGLLEEKIKLSIDSLINNIKFEVKTITTKVKVGSKLDKPLVINVYFIKNNKRISVKNFPLIFRFAWGEGELDENIRTDLNGNVYCKVYRVKSILENNIIEIEPDLDQLLQISNEFEKISELKEKYIFSSFSEKENTKIFIEIKEKNLGKDISESIVETEISRRLIEKEYKIVKEKGMANIIIQGNAFTSLSSKNISIPGESTINIISCSANVKVKITKLPPKEIIFSKDLIDVKGFGATEEIAGLNALKSAAKEMAQILSEKFE